MLLCGGAFAAAKWATIDVLQDDITVIVDGEQVTESNFVYNDRTYLPLRAVAEAVGKPVEYDEATNTAYIGSKPVTATTPSTSGTSYYQEVPWCPDFGAFTNLTPISIDKTNNGYRYMYKADSSANAMVKINDYAYEISTLGFKLDSSISDDVITYCKDAPEGGKYYIGIVQEGAYIGIGTFKFIL